MEKSDDSKRIFIRKLRDSVESLLDETSDALSTRKSYIASPCIDRYKDRRQQMERAGMSKDDIEYYDSRFKNLTWELVGLEAPKFL